MKINRQLRLERCHRLLLDLMEYEEDAWKNLRRHWNETC